MLVREELLSPSPLNYFDKKQSRDAGTKQTVTVFNEFLMFPEGRINAQPDKPPGQDVEVYLFHQLALAPDRTEDL